MQKRVAAIRLTLAVFILFLVVERLPAWSDGGHKVVALLAYDQASPAVRMRVLQDLRLHPRWKQDFEPGLGKEAKSFSAGEKDQWIFAQASIWPDLARGFDEDGQKRYHRRSWHFVNQPVYADAASREALQQVVKPNTSSRWDSRMAEGELNGLQAMERARWLIRQPGTRAQDRAVLLCWVFHLVGDLHQPLHTVSLFSKGQFEDPVRGDQGGNLVPVRTSRMGKPLSLHRLWDGLLGGNGGFNDARRRAYGILADPVLSHAASRGRMDKQVSTWAWEGQKAAVVSAYPAVLTHAIRSAPNDDEGNLLPVVLPYQYEKRAGEVAEVRAAVAGYRLAMELERLYAGR